MTNKCKTDVAGLADSQTNVPVLFLLTPFEFFVHAWQGMAAGQIYHNIIIVMHPAFIYICYGVLEDFISAVYWCINENAPSVPSFYFCGTLNPDFCFSPFFFSFFVVLAFCM